MLDSAQLRRLRNGLLECGPSCPNDCRSHGDLRGKTYAVLAELLAREFQRDVTPGSVRHYVRGLLARGDKVETPRRGWPAKKKRQQAHPKKGIPWAFLYRELLLLTGWSVAKLYDHLDKQGYKGPPRRTFYEQMARAGTHPTSPSMIRDKGTLTERCTVRLHQVVFAMPTSGTYWVLLCGFEVLTGFLNVAVLDVRVDSDHARRRGRPKKIPSGECLAVIEQTPEGDFLQLDERLWWNFATETINRLGLPVSHFEFAADFGLKEMAREHQLAKCLLVPCSQVFPRVSSYVVDEQVFRAVKEKLSSAVVGHNETTFKSIRELRLSVGKRLKDAREQGRPALIPKKLPRDLAERLSLMDYYSGMDGVIQHRLGKFPFHPEKIRARIEVQANLPAGRDSETHPPET